jgi:hypothetical protein
MTRGIPSDLIHGKAELFAKLAEAPKTIDFLPYVFPPNNFVPFDVVNSQTIAIGPTTVVIPIFGPVNSNAVIRWFANEAASAAEYAFLTWTILVGGIPYPPYVAMLLSRGTIDNPDPIIIRIAPNRIVTVTVTNSDAGAAHLANTRVKGWIY